MIELKIEAIVKFNSGYAYVFNRKPDYKYQRDGSLLWAKDGPFYSCYKYDAPSPAFKAFDGREFNLNLIDGGVVKCNGQWWDGGIDKISDKLNLNLGSLTMQIKDDLINCFVFFGTSCDLDELEKLKSKYYGVIYEYRDYERVINYDIERRKHWNRRSYDARAKNHLINKVKQLSAEIKRLKG